INHLPRKVLKRAAGAEYCEICGIKTSGTLSPMPIGPITGAPGRCAMPVRKNRQQHAKRMCLVIMDNLMLKDNRPNSPDFGTNSGCLECRYWEWGTKMQ